MYNITTVSGRSKLPSRREPYWHRLTKGAALGFSAGHSTWHVRVRRPDGRQAYHPLGKFDDAPSAWFDLARTAAEKHTGALKQGARNTYTVGDAIEAYIVRRRRDVPTDRADQVEKDDRSKLAHVSEKDRVLRLADLTVDWLEHWQNQLHTRKENCLQPQTARRVRCVLVAALNEAWRTGKCADAPWRRARTIPGKTGKRDYFPTRREVAKLLKAADPHLRDWLDVQRLTGCRPGEASAFLCGDYLRSNRTLSLREGKTGPRVIHLSDAGVKLLNRLTKGRLGHAPLCPQPNGEAWLKGAEQRPFIAARLAAGVPLKFVCYSLRHYCISQSLLAGVPMLSIAQNCGTSLAMIQQHYGKFQPTTHRELLNKVKL